MHASLPAGEIFFVDEGKGAPVLFLHGLAGDHAGFERQAPALVDEFRVIRVDARGHGRSATPPGAWKIRDFAADFIALLDHLEIEKAHFVGHSAGGVFSMRTAIDYPGRVASLFLVGTSAELKTSIADGTYLKWADMAEKDGLGPALKDAGLPPVPEATEAQTNGFVRACRAISALAREPLAPELPSVRCPACFLVGDKDPFGVGGSVKASRGIPGAELDIWAGQGHVPFRKDPDEFNRRLRDFLRKV